MDLCCFALWRLRLEGFTQSATTCPTTSAYVHSSTNAYFGALAAMQSPTARVPLSHRRRICVNLKTNVSQCLLTASQSASAHMNRRWSKSFATLHSLLAACCVVHCAVQIPFPKLKDKLSRLARQANSKYIDVAKFPM